MAIGDYTDFVLDPMSFHDGLFNFVTQNINGFNAASQGAIRLNYRNLPGHTANNLKFNLPEDIFTRRDITTNAAIASADKSKVSETNERSVKLNRKVYIHQTLDSFRKSFAGVQSYEEASFIVGQQIGERRLKIQFNDALLSLRAALAGQSTSLYTVPTSGKLNSADLNLGMALIGDSINSVKCLVMHSKAWFDLIGNQITANIDGVSDFNLFAGQPATFGKPVLVTDSDALKVASGSGSTATVDYYTLGLTDSAAEVIVSENPTLIGKPETGFEQLQMIIQGEDAYNMQLKGFTWDLGNGGINPTAVALATSTNWDLALASVKQRGGFIIKSK